jgi:hypothetical protein
MNIGHNPDHLKNQAEKPAIKDTVIETKQVRRIDAIITGEKKFAITIRTENGNIINKAKEFLSEEELETIKEFCKLKDIFSKIIEQAYLQDNFVYEDAITLEYSKLLNIPFSNSGRHENVEFWLNSVVNKIEEVISLAKKIELLNKLKGLESLQIPKFIEELNNLKTQINNQDYATLIPPTGPTLKGAHFDYEIISSNTPTWKFTSNLKPPKTALPSEAWTVYRYRLNILASYLENLQLQLDKFHRIYKTSNILLLNGSDYLSLDTIKLTIEKLSLKPTEGIGFSLIEKIMLRKPESASKQDTDKWAKEFWKTIIVILKNYLRTPEYLNAKKMFSFFHKLPTEEKIFNYPILKDDVIENFITAIEEEIE